LIESPLLLTAVVAAATALAFLLDYKIAPLSKLGASLLAILFGALLSNLGIVTAASPIYGTISGSVTSLAIAWLLLAVNLADLKKAGRRMVGAFVLAVTGTALGAFVWGPDLRRALRGGHVEAGRDPDEDLLRRWGELRGGGEGPGSAGGSLRGCHGRRQRHDGYLAGGDLGAAIVADSLLSDADPRGGRTV
jgi:hypothetical protein